MTALDPGVASARQQLITSCQGLVRSIAWKIHQRLPAHVDLEDLVAYGQVGLAEAARDFDAGRGGQFTTYAWYRIRGAILDGLSRMRWFDRSDFEGGKYERMANEALADDVRPDAHGGETPRDAVSREGGWLKGISSTLAVACLGAWSGAADIDLPDGDLERPDEILIRRELAVILRELVDKLPSDMGTLVKATYFQGRTLTEAAAEVGISKAWASRLHSRALRSLAAALEEAGFE